LNKKDGYESDSVLTLEPTSPFRSPELIECCIALFKDPGVDSAIGVTETRSNYGKIVNGKFEYLFPGQPRRRSGPSASLYGKQHHLRHAHRCFAEEEIGVGRQTGGVDHAENEAVDINTPFDFELAERLMASSRQKEGVKI
jgi:CMP-N-acetylneuraminic acid synthetase